MEAAFSWRFAHHSRQIIKPWFIKDCACIIWPFFLSCLALDLSEVTDGVSYCSKELIVSAQCSCTSWCHHGQSDTDTHYWLSADQHRQICWGEDGRSLDSSLWNPHLHCSPPPNGKKWGSHLLAQLCSMFSGLCKSQLTLELCSLHQTLLGKAASTKCLSWTRLNSSSAQDHQPPLPSPRCLLDLNEELTLHASGGNTCDLLPAVKAKAQIPTRKQGMVWWLWSFVELGICPLQCELIIWHSRFWCSLCRVSRTSELLCPLPGDKKNIQLVGEDQIFHFLGKL